MGLLSLKEEPRELAHSSFLDVRMRREVSSLQIRRESSPEHALGLPASRIVRKTFLFINHPVYSSPNRLRHVVSGGNASLQKCACGILKAKPVKVPDNCVISPPELHLLFQAHNSNQLSFSPLLSIP